MKTLTYEEFDRVDIRSGTILKVEEFTRAKKPAFKSWCCIFAICVARARVDGHVA